MSSVTIEQAHKDREAARARIRAGLRVGSIWGSPRARYHAIVLADVEEPGRFRMTTFDGQGFSGHTSRDTLAEIGEVLLMEFGASIVQREAGLLDEMARGFEVGP